ncbi:MAG: ATP F0F1 synthase subunit B [Rhodobiaceae bacterium]|nr:ATP F0F1 synthase subunit B [Rhodobiaceae bacterium]MCC0054828.1 ATP F0F1 synthase subunit B [Rhodobiaceae bacterium]
MELDATFYALIALLIFLAIVIYMKVPGLIAGSLDGRAANIAREIDEAKRLRDEAQGLLAEYQRKQRDAEREAEDIIAQAREEAERMTREAKEALADLIDRRTKAAEAKISQAEAHAFNEVRAAAAEAATAAAERILTEKVTGKAADDLITSSIADIGKQLQ